MLIKELFTHPDIHVNLDYKGMIINDAGKFEFHPWGYIGVGGTIKPTSEALKPKHFRLSFQVTNNSKELYEQIVSIAKSIVLEPHLEVHIKEPYITHKNILKTEYEKQLEDLRNTHEHICECCDQVMPKPCYCSGPNEWYDDVINVSYDNGSVHICCDSSTQFYDTIDELGIIDSLKSNW